MENDIKTNSKDQMFKTGTSEKQIYEANSEGHRTMNHDHATMQEADLIGKYQLKK